MSELTIIDLAQSPRYQAAANTILRCHHDEIAYTRQNWSDMTNILNLPATEIDTDAIKRAGKSFWLILAADVVIGFATVGMTSQLYAKAASIYDVFIDQHYHTDAVYMDATRLVTQRLFTLSPTIERVAYAVASEDHDKWSCLEIGFNTNVEVLVLERDLVSQPVNREIAECQKR